jgi:hypothetical protein
VLLDGENRIIPPTKLAVNISVRKQASELVSGNPEGRCDPDPDNHSLYQNRMTRQQYIVDTLHPSGFI